LAQKPPKRPFGPNLCARRLAGSGLLTCSAHSQWNSPCGIKIWFPGDPAIGPETPQKAIRTEPLRTEVGQLWSVDVFSTFPMEFPVWNPNLVRWRPSHWPRNPLKGHSDRTFAHGGWPVQVCVRVQHIPNGIPRLESKFCSLATKRLAQKPPKRPFGPNLCARRLASSCLWTFSAPSQWNSPFGIQIWFAGDPAIRPERPQKAIRTEPLRTEVGRFRSVDVFSAFPMEFPVWNPNLVRWRPSDWPRTPEKGHSDRTFAHAGWPVQVCGRVQHLPK